MTDPAAIIATTACPRCGRELAERAYRFAGMNIRRVDRCECEPERDPFSMAEMKAIEAQALARMIADVRKRCTTQIAEVYWMQGFDSYVVTPRNAKAVEAAKAFAALNGGPRLLHIWGTPGVGKTRLAYAVGTEVLRAGNVVGFVNSSSLATARKDADFWAWLLRDPRVVILDDLGKEIIGGFCREDFTSALYELTNAIYTASDRGLVQTTELDLNRIMDRYQSDALRWRWNKLSAGGAPIKITKE